MIDNEIILFDRLNVIKDLINKHGEENFYISFSGGKDSTILHYLVDEALPGNKIPRVFSNTGIEYTAIVEFVKELSSNDDRFVLINPTKNIKMILEEKGYPFKSKQHCNFVKAYQTGNCHTLGTKKYVSGEYRDKCPKKLLYHFTDENKLKISNLCCNELKKKPMKKWEKENNRYIYITGMRSEEGGQRQGMGCILTNKDGKLKSFHPLAKVSEEWENWYMETRGFKICKLYYPPFNFKRTGCKGCPFSLKLQEQLNIMEELLPNERKQCEMIWKPVYEEYRRIGYRLKDKKEMTISE